MGSDIVLLTVLESDTGEEQTKYRRYAKRMVPATKQHAEKYMEHEGKAIKVEAATRTGNPAKAILEYVDQGNSDLIVMASHGRSGISRWAVGSVADKVVRANSRHPVIVIRAKESRSDVREKRILKKALVPLDGTIGSRAVIPYIIKIASKLKMEITLLQVVPQDDHLRPNAESYLRSECTELEVKGLKASHRVSTGAVADRIVDLADELAVDLVAMSTHGGNGFNLLSLGSVAERVFLGGNTPLLLVRQ
jgi:nucleotide-binding universal stress UspA family protein